MSHVSTPWPWGLAGRGGGVGWRRMTFQTSRMLVAKKYKSVEECCLRYLKYIKVTDSFRVEYWTNKRREISLFSVSQNGKHFKNLRSSSGFSRPGWRNHCSLRVTVQWSSKIRKQYMVKHEKLSLVGLEINKSLWFNFWWSRKLAGGLSVCQSLVNYIKCWGKQNLKPHKVGFF